MPEPIARVRGLRYRYPGATTPAVDGIDLDVERGEVLVLAGPSGGGKSTILRALAGLVPHFHGGTFGGRVVVDGLDTRDASPAAVCSRAGIVFQDPEAQLIHRDVVRDVAFALATRGHPATELVAGATAALGRVRAAHLVGRDVERISGGERQRVAVAGALAPRPGLLLLDEPASQLDAETAEALLDDLAALARGGVAVVIAEHRLDRLQRIAHRIAWVREGRLADGPARDAEALPAALRAAPGPTVLAAVGIHHALGGRDVLRGADLDVGAGSIVGLVGENGSGKTTLLRILAGLARPDAGSVWCEGGDVTDVPAEERFGRLALVVQDPSRHLVRERVDDELADGCARLLLDAPSRRARVEDVLALLDLTALAARHPRELSVGERERVALGVALAADPGVLLLDEPTRGMDGPRRLRLAALLRERAARGRSAVIATHDPTFAAAACDVAARLVDGRIAALEPLVAAR